MVDCKKYVKLFEDVNKNGYSNTGETFLRFLEYITLKLGVESGDESFLEDLSKIKDNLGMDVLCKYDEIYTLIKEDINNNINDYLGSIYMTIGRNNKALGQFFTPWHIANFMSAITGSNEPNEDKEFYTVSDPTCGSGVMLIANYNNIKNTKLNEKWVAVGQDLDINCVRMTYIQLSMLGVPACVIQGDSLLNERRRIFLTKDIIKNDIYKKVLC